MKEMVYSYETGFEILEENDYRGFHYKVISRKAWPCAYVMIPKDHPFFEKHYDEVSEMADIDVHGGFTFSNYMDDGDVPGWYLGWDYAHNGDYNPLAFYGGKRWTTAEMVEHCKRVVDGLCAYQEKKK